MRRKPGLVAVPVDWIPFAVAVVARVQRRQVAAEPHAAAVAVAPAVAAVAESVVSVVVAVESAVPAVPVVVFMTLSLLLLSP